jgi:hypothetical protein
MVSNEPTSLPSQLEMREGEGAASQLHTGEDRKSLPEAKAMLMHKE